MRAALSVLVIISLCGECAAYLSSGKGYSAGVYPPSSIIRFDGTNLNITQRNWNDADAGIGTKSISSPKDLWVGDFYHALFERCKTAQTTIPTTPSWYRSERSMLVSYKSRLSSLCRLFVIHTPNVVESFVASNRCDASLNWVTNLMWTKQALLQSVGAPTNYLDYTPYRDLAGVASATTTNNSFVYAPYSDADYGWKWMQAIVSQLQYTVRFGMQGSNRAYTVGWHYVTNEPPWLERCEKFGHVSTGWTSPLECNESGFGTRGSWGVTDANIFDFWQMVLRTSKIEAWVDSVYTNREIADPLTVRADVYFGACLEGYSYPDSQYLFSGPWTETGIGDRNNATDYIGKQLADQVPSGSEFRIRIVDMERAPEPPDPDPLPYYTGYMLNRFSMFIMKWNFHY